MAIHNIAEYKKAKVVVKDLEKALKIINATEASLKSLSHYRPIWFILTTISDSKRFIEIYLNEHKIIVETKGQKGF